LLATQPAETRSACPTCSTDTISDHSAEQKRRIGKDSQDKTARRNETHAQRIAIRTLMYPFVYNESNKNVKYGDDPRTIDSQECRAYTSSQQTTTRNAKCDDAAN